MQHIIKFDYVSVYVETTSPEELQALFMIAGKMRLCEIISYGSDCKIRIIDKQTTIESNTKYLIESLEE